MKKKKSFYGLIAFAAVVSLAIYLLLNHANRIIEYELRQFLGKGFSVADVSIRWGHVAARDISLLRPDNKEAFSAKDLSVRANFIGLLKSENVISAITLDAPILFIEIDKKGAIIFPWPLTRNVSPADRTTKNAGGNKPFLIKKLEVRQGSLDYLDNKVAAGPALIRMRDIHAELKNFSSPPDDRISSYEFRASIPANPKRGELNASGVLNLKTRDTKTKLTVRELDVTQLRPYYEKKGDAEVVRGLLSLDADITIHDKKIHAAGKVRFKDLEFKKESGTVLGAPHRAVSNLLKDNDGQITLDFTVEGDLNNPKFSIRESIVRKLTLSLAKSLGMPIESLGKSILDLGGSALEKLFR